MPLHVKHGTIRADKNNQSYLLIINSQIERDSFMFVYVFLVVFMGFLLQIHAISGVFALKATIKYLHNIRVK